MSNQPTDLQRARWWHSGWAGAYNKAAALDRLTVMIKRREWRSVVRYYRARYMACEAACMVGERELCDANKKL